ncbi:MAG: enoyl-CoA hydratase/isomerase family protein [Alphaproteobacteria bacterium]
MPETDSTLPILTIEGPRATIRLNRPRQHNRIEPGDLRALARSFARIADDSSVRVLVLTGTGRSFSAGYDIGAIGQGDGEPTPPFGDVVDALEALPQPTIAALNGGVYGGSTDLALACDFRIGVEGMRMLMPAARLGLHYYGSGMRRYVERLGIAAAKRLFLTAAELDAPAMRAIGYLDEVVPADALAARVDALVDALAAGASGAIVAMKRTLNRIACGAYDKADADAAHAVSVRSEEAAEGVRAWKEKRPPRFAAP